jgi:adenylate cyclase
MVFSEGSAMPKASPPPPSGWVKARRYHLLAPLLALAVMAILQQTTPLVDLLENLTVNLRFKARAPFDPPTDPRLVFIGIDEVSLAEFGKWPWPRAVEADFLKAIGDGGLMPHTLSFDLMFTEDSDKLGLQSSAEGASDTALGEAVGLFPSVITGALSLPEPEEAMARKDAEERTKAQFANPGPTQPLPNFKGDIGKMNGSNVAVLPVLPVRTQSLFGFVNDDPSPLDDIRHTIPLVLRVGDKVYPSLALQTLCQMLNVDPGKVGIDLPAGVVTLKNSSKTWNIPINEKGEFAINYRREQNFHTISFFGLMQNLHNHVANGTPIAKDCDIGNKTLLIGQAATGLGDMGPTPLTSRSPLPFAHLNVINNVLKNDYLRFVPWYWVVIGWALVTWPSLLRLKDAPLVEAVVAPIGIVLLYTVFTFALFWLWSVQIALAWPVIAYGAVNFGGVVLRWREEQKGRQQIKQVFSQMLSPEVMGHLLDHPENIKMGGSKRAVTILFSDIRDYTKFSEGLEEEELVRQLNIYFERMVDCVKECGGTLHKFIGDAVMSVWGDIASVSLGEGKDARNAVRSALMMRLRLRELNEERRVLHQTPLRIGIGLNHGDVLVGLIGASSRSEFTVMGDAVNTASRLEGMTKEFKTDLAISESVRLLIGDEFLVRRLGLIVLKGKTKPTVVFEVLAETSDLGRSKLKPETVALYEKAFDDFLARRFAEAEAGFVACGRDYPDDYCVQNYLEASREFIAHPPPADWDGRIVMTTK